MTPSPSSDSRRRGPATGVAGNTRPSGSAPPIYDCDTLGDVVAITRRAWQVLLDNQDLFVEAAERYTGRGRASTIDEMLDAEGAFAANPVHVQCADLGGFTADYKGKGEYQPGQTGRRLRLDVAYVVQLDDLWAAASWTSGREKRKGQACPVIDLAATIAHELVHTLGLASGDEADQGFSSYEVENYLRYHLARRYCVLGWGCCNWENEDGDSGDDCRNFACLVGDPRFRSDTYRIDLGLWYDPQVEDDRVGGHNACVGTGPCAH